MAPSASPRLRARPADDDPGAHPHPVIAGRVMRSPDTRSSDLPTAASAPPTDTAPPANGWSPVEESSLHVSGTMA